AEETPGAGAASARQLQLLTSLQHLRVVYEGRDGSPPIAILARHDLGPCSSEVEQALGKVAVKAGGLSPFSAWSRELPDTALNFACQLAPSAAPSPSARRAAARLPGAAALAQALRTNDPFANVCVAFVSSFHLDLNPIWLRFALQLAQRLASPASPAKSASATPEARPAPSELPPSLALCAAQVVVLPSTVWLTASSGDPVACLTLPVLIAADPLMQADGLRLAVFSGRGAAALPSAQPASFLQPMCEHTAAEVRRCLAQASSAPFKAAEQWLPRSGEEPDICIALARASTQFQRTETLRSSTGERLLVSLDVNSTVSPVQIMFQAHQLKSLMQWAAELESEPLPAEITSEEVSALRLCFVLRTTVALKASFSVEAGLRLSDTEATAVLSLSLFEQQLQEAGGEPASPARCVIEDLLAPCTVRLCPTKTEGDATLPGRQISIEAVALDLGQRAELCLLIFSLEELLSALPSSPPTAPPAPEPSPAAPAERSASGEPTEETIVFLNSVTLKIPGPEEEEPSVVSASGLHATLQTLSTGRQRQRLACARLGVSILDRHQVEAADLRVTSGDADTEVTVHEGLKAHLVTGRLFGDLDVLWPSAREVSPGKVKAKQQPEDVAQVGEASTPSESPGTTFRLLVTVFELRLCPSVRQTQRRLTLRGSGASLVSKPKELLHCPPGLPATSSQRLEVAVEALAVDAQRDETLAPLLSPLSLDLSVVTTSPLPCRSLAVDAVPQTALSLNCSAMRWSAGAWQLGLLIDVASFRDPDKQPPKEEAPATEPPHQSQAETHQRPQAEMQRLWLDLWLQGDDAAETPADTSPPEPGVQGPMRLLVRRTPSPEEDASSWKALQLPSDEKAICLELGLALAGSVRDVLVPTVANNEFQVSGFDAAMGRWVAVSGADALGFPRKPAAAALLTPASCGGTPDKAPSMELELLWQELAKSNKKEREAQAVLMQQRMSDLREMKAMAAGRRADLVAQAASMSSSVDASNREESERQWMAVHDPLEKLQRDWHAAVVPNVPKSPPQVPADDESWGKWRPGYRSCYINARQQPQPRLHRNGLSFQARVLSPKDEDLNPSIKREPERLLVELEVLAASCAPSSSEFTVAVSIPRLTWSAAPSDLFVSVPVEGDQPAAMVNAEEAEEQAPASSDSVSSRLPPQLNRLPADKLVKVHEALGTLKEAGLTDVKDLAALSECVKANTSSAGNARMPSEDLTSEYMGANLWAWTPKRWFESIQAQGAPAGAKSEEAGNGNEASEDQLPPIPANLQERFDRHLAKMTQRKEASADSIEEATAQFNEWFSRMMQNDAEIRSLATMDRESMPIQKGDGAGVWFDPIKTAPAGRKVLGKVNLQSKDIGWIGGKFTGDNKPAKANVAPSVISLHLGAEGGDSGAACWKRLMEEHCLDGNGRLGGDNTQSCSYQRERLDTPAECRDAAAVLGLTYGYTGSYSRWPRYCFTYRDLVYFNEDAVNSAGRHDARLVCKRVEPTTTTTTTTILYDNVVSYVIGAPGFDCAEGHVVATHGECASSELITQTGIHFSNWASTNQMQFGCLYSSTLHALFFNYFEGGSVDYDYSPVCKTETNPIVRHFDMGDFDTNSCRHGQPIDDSELCRESAASFGEVFSTSGSYSGYPMGCFKFLNGHFYGSSTPFFAESTAGRYVPRAIVAGYDADRLNSLAATGQFAPTSVLVGGNVGSEFASGEDDNGYREEIMEGIRQQMEKADFVEGFLLTNGSGEGLATSGMASKLLADLSCSYGKQAKMTFTCTPDLQGEKMPLVSSALLCPSLLEFTELVNFYDLAALHAAMKPSEQPLGVLARVFSGMTGPMRFGRSVSAYQGSRLASLNAIQVNLVCYPRIHFALPGIACGSSEDGGYGAAAKALTAPLCSVEQRKSIAFALMGRGAEQSCLISRAAAYKLSKECDFVDYCPTGFAISTFKDEKSTEAEITALHNTTAVGQVFQKMLHDGLDGYKSPDYNAESMVHETRENLAALMSDYDEIAEVYKPPEYEDDEEFEE
ncbi:unnamed protein product, partial [Symbiodinium sp. CCMP2592]